MTKYKNSVSHFRLKVADYLGVPEGHIGLFWKGRIALYAILKAMGIGPGDEVILPGFTCVVVANAVIYLGAKPIYADINPQTMNIDSKQISSLLTDKTKAILAQNTFGLSSDFNQIRAVAGKKGIKIIEDCAHGFGGISMGRPNGTTADAAFFSTQWNKPFTTGFGGISLTKDPELAVKIRDIEKSADKPGLKERILLKMMIVSRDYFLTPMIYHSALELYRNLGRKGIIPGSSGNSELENAQIPSCYLKSFTSVQAIKGIAELAKMTFNLEHRKKTAQIYDEMLVSLGLKKHPSLENEGHIFLKYPLLVKDKRSFFTNANRAGIETGDWFLSPLHPVEGSLIPWQYQPGTCPIAEKICRHIVNLHTHTGIKGRILERTRRFLQRERDNISSLPLLLGR